MAKQVENRLSTPTIAVVLILLAVLAAGFGALYYWEQKTDVVEDDGNYDDIQSIYGIDTEGVVSFTDADENEDYYIYKDDIETYLIIGTDASGNQDTENGKEYDGKMADFLVLLVFDKTRKTYELLQLNRDTITQIPLIDEEGEGEATKLMQLCIAHWFGGTQELNAENTVRAVSDMLGGLPIKGYLEMNMDDIGTFNHALGGVTVTIEDDYLEETYPDLKYGETITLTDEQAWQFVHARMEVGDDTNEARMERQKAYLTAAIQKASTVSNVNQDYADQVYEAIKDTVFTNVYGNYISRFANYFTSYENAGVTSIPGQSKIGYVLDDGLPHSEFYIEQEDIIDTLTNVYHIAKYE